MTAMRDVIVIGGGPAGATAATLLAQRGFSVTLLERERFPRFQSFKVGLFFFLVALQKRLGNLAPRIAWDALPAAAAKLS